MNGDVNSILRAYFFGQSWPLLPPRSILVSVVGDRIYCPRLPEKAILPALAFFVRGGNSNPYVPDIVEPSFQFDCWGRDPIEARSIYRALYESLQGIENQLVAVGEDTYRILSAIEEVQGQDIQDIEYPGYHRVIAFFRVRMEI